MSDIVIRHDADAYQLEACRTAGNMDGSSIEDKLIRGGLGIAGEGGEVADTIKKIIFHGLPTSDEQLDHIAEELGDVLWYIAVLANDLGYPLSYIMNMNVAKLRARYPDGRFDPVISQARVSQQMRALKAVDDMVEYVQHGTVGDES